VWRPRAPERRTDRTGTLRDRRPIHTWAFDEWALLNEPRIVLADEPTGNLDTQTGAVVIGALVAMAHEEGATVIIASHDPEVVAACDEVLGL
jgi:ABC-type cobalamin/Fe3+-siderophores transport system ATPase subunit